jgi:hypothetical protein
MRKKAAKNHLLKRIEDNYIDIILIQEPYVMKQKVCGFSTKIKKYFYRNWRNTKNSK